MELLIYGTRGHYILVDGNVTIISFYALEGEVYYASS